MVDVRPRLRLAFCSGCGKRQSRLHDRRLRQWRHVDAVGMRVELRYSLRRVNCRRCGVQVEMVPWAERGSWFTYAFEQFVASLAQRTDKTTVSTLLRVAWRTVGAIVTRVMKRSLPTDLLDGLRRVGVDELSYRKYHEYVTVVVDHDTGRVVWADEGRSADTLAGFFNALGAERCSKLETVTIDMLGSFKKAIEQHAPNARIIFDRFHVQRLAHDALDQVRRQQVRETRHEDRDAARAIKHSRWSLQKNDWRLTEAEEQKLAAVQRYNKTLYRAYLLKESLRWILDRTFVPLAKRKLREWVSWALRSRLAPFKRVAKTIRGYFDGIMGYVETRLSNGRTEGMNGKIRTITRRAYGFHSAQSLIALIFLCCSCAPIGPPHRGAA